jgi:RLL motif-containing protein 1
MAHRAGRFSNKLKALRYAEWKTFDVTDESQTRRLVAWLESVVIRFYKPEDRAILTDVDNKANKWTEAFAQYLADLGYPKQYKHSPKELVTAIEWLLTYAIGLEYADNAAKYNADAAEYIKRKETLDSPPQLEYSDEVKRAIRDLADTLKLPSCDDYDILLNTIFHIIQRKFSKHAIAEALDPKAATTKVDVNSEIFPLGFDTGDEILNKAATILRMLYVADLRDLQTQINEMICALQSLTANPKTDTTLGKVGK